MLVVVDLRSAFNMGPRVSGSTVYMLLVTITNRTDVSAHMAQIYGFLIACSNIGDLSLLILDHLIGADRQVLIQCYWMLTF